MSIKFRFFDPQISGHWQSWSGTMETRMDHPRGIKRCILRGRSRNQEVQRSPITKDTARSSLSFIIFLFDTNYWNIAYMLRTIDTSHTHQDPKSSITPSYIPRTPPTRHSYTSIAPDQTFRPTLKFQGKLHLNYILRD